MSKVISIRSILTVCLLNWLLAFTSLTQADGTFRFLTTQLPDGSTDREYFSVLLTANASGPITFNAVSLPPGLSLDTKTGNITGKPTVVDPNSSVNITATDGTNTISFIDTIRITATGGGGNGGLHITKSSLAEGAVGALYSDTITAAFGTPPYIWGAQNLPAGLSLNGLTGEITGNPVSAGTFYVTFTLSDAIPNQVITTIPLTILPEGSQFKFQTYLLNNGEVGTPYSDTWLTTDASTCGAPPASPVAFSASGLPDGLSVNGSTGLVSGVPTEAGTFSVILMAQDCAGHTITTNLWLWTEPSSSSHFYWNYFGIPAAVYGADYGDSNFPILVSTRNGSSVTYSVIGLPSGINYNSSTGELSGVSYEPGIYPAVFTATDTGPNPDVEIKLSTEFIVLPPNGGDTNSLAVNLWVQKLHAGTGQPGKNDDSWNATFLYNANRTAASLFNPDTEIFYVSLGSSEINLAPGKLKRKNADSLSVLTYVTPPEEALPGAPFVKIKIEPKKQLISVKARNSDLGTTLPADSLPNALVLGGKSFKLKEYLNQRGNFRVPFGYRSSAFVVVKGLLRTHAADAKNYARFNLLLANPAFDYHSGDPVRIRLLDGQSELINKELTSLLTSSTGIDRKTGVSTFTLKKTKKGDAAGSNRLAKFYFKSATGKLNFELQAPTLAALTDTEEHLGVEISIGSRSYFTSATLFKLADGRYSTTK